MATNRPVDPNARNAKPRSTPRSSPTSAPARPAPAKKSKIATVGKAVGLAGLAGLGAYAAVKGGQYLTGTTESQLARKNLMEYMRSQRENDINAISSSARAESYRESIAQNLARVQQYAPDLYMRVAAGRQLPQGAVVLGGAPREDLLQDLGRAMADGRFNQ